METDSQLLMGGKKCCQSYYHVDNIGQTKPEIRV
jgi:hypothetical protein